MCARSLNVHGRTSSEPRSTLAKSQGRMPGDRAAGGVFLWLPFFAQAKKVTRSPAGRVEALHFKGRERKYKELDYTRLLSRALWAIRYANVRSGILPPQSGFRRNDEQRK
jgi:hypothetical protein